MVGAIISAVVAIASGIQQAKAQRAAAQQSEYDAEFERKQFEMAAEQERMNREAARKIEARASEADKRMRRAMLARAGGGMGEAAIQELSRQASLDEINIVNADLESVYRRRSMQRSGLAAFQAGRFRADLGRNQAGWTLASSFGSAAGSIASGWEARQRHQQQLQLNEQRHQSSLRTRS